MFFLIHGHNAQKSSFVPPVIDLAIGLTMVGIGIAAVLTSSQVGIAYALCGMGLTYAFLALCITGALAYAKKFESKSTNQALPWFPYAINYVNSSR